MIGKVHAVAARRVFDGVAVREDAAVVMNGAEIAGIIPRAQVPNAIQLQELPDDAWLAPGFIDMQVNGGGDVLFNDAPIPETVRTILAAHRKFGTTSLLPTLISDSTEKTAAAMAAVDALLGVEPGVLGLHLEGPFLSPEKPGVHDPKALRRPTADDVAALTKPRRGVTVVTLAPEEVSDDFIAKLAAANLRLCLGHSMASYERAQAAIGLGVTGFTHLFNAMRPLDAREPGPIAAALLSARAWYGLIVDGIHVAPPMLQLALRGAGHPMLVTDAMPPVGGTSSTFTLFGETISVRDGRCVRSDGKLAGACLDMASAVRNCVKLLDVPLTEALRFASAYPAQFLGFGHALGRLEPGFRADLVAFDASTIEVIGTWVAGSAGNL